jgi:hypothetical protein
MNVLLKERKKAEERRATKEQEHTLQMDERAVK